MALPKLDTPETTSDFTIDVEGEITKHRYVGEFTCKIKNHRDKANAAKFEAQLNGELADNLDILTRNLHHMIAQLKYSITESPKWWVESNLGYDLYDHAVIRELFESVIEFENEWFKLIWGDVETEVEDVESEADDGSTKEA